ncbi:hypothetical protein PoB_003537300 [Plakobranchus ocellatus]|uniref:Uncharacterized protein n=1 Tax=Plakobranchus ocellatus TaxID=259542 RepID=A0AAV4APX2_9GAST|nr:hypothetical protein PoB_003537300 [Plakobranchus ocellatus]
MANSGTKCKHRLLTDWSRYCTLVKSTTTCVDFVCLYKLDFCTYLKSVLVFLLNDQTVSSNTEEELAKLEAELTKHQPFGVKQFENCILREELAPLHTAEMKAFWDDLMSNHNGNWYLAAVDLFNEDGCSAQIFDSDFLEKAVKTVRMWMRCVADDVHFKRTPNGLSPGGYTDDVWCLYGSKNCVARVV